MTNRELYLICTYIHAYICTSRSPSLRKNFEEFDDGFECIIKLRPVSFVSPTHVYRRTIAIVGPARFVRNFSFPINEFSAFETRTFFSPFSLGLPPGSLAVDFFIHRIIRRKTAFSGNRTAHGRRDLQSALFLFLRAQFYYSHGIIPGACVISRVKKRSRPSLALRTRGNSNL